MLLRAGYILVAQKLQEAATAMCHEDIRTRLSDCLNDTFRGTGTWCYVVAVFGDDKAGDVVYSASSDLKKAPYTISAGSTKIDTAAAVDVQPLTTYETETVEATEAGARNSKRDLRQLQTIHDSAAALGANCTMAESRRSSASPSDRTRDNAGNDSTRDASESGNQNASAGLSRDAGQSHGHREGGDKSVLRETSLQLVESAQTLETIVLQEARADYEIKLIAPGLGSSAFYPAEVLKRDGPKVFTEGTHVYLNHPTAAEEAARPEGDVKNLAGVLSSTAVYHESHAKGAGLYARMKVFADHAQQVEEKAAHVGMSIRAGGVAESGKTQGGRPVLKELTSAESVDIVTRAGAGGMVLTESARTDNPTQEAAMDAAEFKKLQESLDKGLATIALREARLDAKEQAMTMLESLNLPREAKAEILHRVMESVPMKDNVLDAEKFKESVTAEAKRIGALIASISGGSRVRGMGAADVIDIDPVKAKEAKDRAKAEKLELHEVAESVFGELMGNPTAAKLAASKGEAA